MSEFYFWLILLLAWLVLYRPGMVQWWRERAERKVYLADLDAATCVEDMFGESK